MSVVIDVIHAEWRAGEVLLSLNTHGITNVTPILVGGDLGDGRWRERVVKEALYFNRDMRRN